MNVKKLSKDWLTLRNIIQNKEKKLYYIYRITNKINGKTYIGKHEYKKLDEYYMGSGVLLKKAQKKYGMKNFEKKILVFNISKLEHVNLLEKTFIAAEREKVGRENCYNRADGGDGNTGKLSEETRKKMAESHTGGHHSEETKRKIAESNKGKRHSDDSYKRASEKMKGRPSSFKGKHHSEEARRKLSEALKDKTPWNKGKPWGEEMKQKIKEVRDAYKKSGRKDWNVFQKEYKEDRCV